MLMLREANSNVIREQASAHAQQLIAGLQELNSRISGPDPLVPPEQLRVSFTANFTIFVAHRFLITR
jgi:hypothetical protein